MSFAAVSFSSPACLSVVWDRFVSDHALRQEPGWAAPLLGRLHMRHGPPFLRAGPTVAEICFLILFCFIISQIYIDIQKYVSPSI